MRVRAKDTVSYKGLPPLFPSKPEGFFVPRLEHEEIFILGGGGSFEGTDPEKLRDKYVIGCNEAFRLGAGIVDWCHFTDLKWWQEHQAELDCFEGVVSTVHALAYGPNIKFLNSSKSGIEFTERNRIAVNRNTGLGAINIAIHMGAKRIVLLGFDMNCSADELHWYREDGSRDMEKTFRMHRRFALEVWEDVEEHGGIEIVNASPNSTIPFWPKCELSEVLP